MSLFGDRDHQTKRLYGWRLKAGNEAPAVVYIGNRRRAGLMGFFLVFSTALVHLLWIAILVVSLASTRPVDD